MATDRASTIHITLPLGAAAIDVAAAITGRVPAASRLDSAAIDGRTLTLTFTALPTARPAPHPAKTETAVG